MALKDWSTTAGNNTSAPPNGWPEGMAPSDVNNSARQMMADIRAWYEDAAWVDLGYVPSYVNAGSFTIAGDVTGVYHPGRRLRLADAGTLYGVVAASSYSAPNTSVTVHLDNGALTSALSAVAVGAVGASASALPNLAVRGGHKNAIINGGFDVWQRGTSFTAAGYTADRWQVAFGSGGAGTVSRQSFAVGGTPGHGHVPAYALQWDQSTIGAGNYLMQPVESVRSFAGQVVTLSFYARVTSGTLSLGAKLRQFFGTGGSPSATVDTASQTASLTSSWQRFSFRFDLAAIAGKTLGSDGNDYLGVMLSGPDAALFTLQLWGVQLEDGVFATPFDVRPLAVEMPMCQRYFWKSFTAAVAPAQNAGLAGAIGLTASGTVSNAALAATVGLAVPMRVVPSITTYNPSAANANWRNIAAGTDLSAVVQTAYSSTQSFLIANNAAAADASFYAIHATASAEF